MNSILLIGGGFTNKGAEALLMAVKDELNKRLAPVRFQAIVPASQATYARKAGFIALESRNWQEFIMYHLGRIQRIKAPAWAWTTASQASRYLNWLKDCAAVLDVSGYAYAETFGMYPIKLTERIVSDCCFSGVPYVCMPQAWGPLNMSYAQQAVRHIAERATLIYARDKTSLQCLQSIPNIPKEKLELAPDIVLKFKPRESRDTIEPLERAGLLPKNCQRVGICPNIKVYRATERQGVGMNNPYVRWLADICKRFLTETDVEVVLFPHEVSLNKWRRDDRYVCRLIQNMISDNRRVRFFSECCSADTLKLLIREIDFLIGSRFHSIITALSFNIPTIAVGWSHKYQEVLNDAGIGELAFSYKIMNNGNTINRVLETWASRKHVHNRLKQSMPILQEQVDNVFDRVAEILRGKEC